MHLTAVCKSRKCPAGDAVSASGAECGTNVGALALSSENGSPSAGGVWESVEVPSDIGVWRVEVHVEAIVWLEADGTWCGEVGVREKGD